MILNTGSLEANLSKVMSTQNVQRCDTKARVVLSTNANVGMELFYDPTKIVDVTEHVVLQMIGGLWCEGLFYDPGQSMIKIF